MQIMLFYELLHLDHFVSISANDEVDVLKLCNDLWYEPNQKVNTLAVLQTRDVHDVDHIFGLIATYLGIRGESHGVHSIGDGEASIRVELGPETEVILAGLTHAYGRIQVPDRPFAELVQIDACHIMEPKQGVLCENGLEAIGLGSHHDALLNHTRALVTMAYVNVLSNEDFANYWKRVPESEKCHIFVDHRNLRQVITF